MKTNRLFEIIYLLMSKKSITAKELAEHFEVSQRTILRDIDSLSSAGIPIYTSQGKGGGISIIDGFVLDKTVITDEEQNQILFALQGLSATESINIEKILSRLRTFFKKEDTDWISVDFSRWGFGEKDNPKFEILKDCIVNKMAISFEYSNTHGETKSRKVYPLKLKFKSKSWYLEAFCASKEDYRTFKITRMRDILKLDEVFDDISFKAIDSKPIQQKVNFIDVKLKIFSDSAYRAYDDFLEHEITKQQDGSLVVSTTMQDDYWLYSYILSYGDSILVLEPQYLIDNVLQCVEKIKNLYKT